MARPKKNKTTDEVALPAPSRIVDLDAEVTDAVDNVVVQEMTLAKFKKEFKDEIQSTMDWLWREDKEKVFKTKKVLKEAAIAQVRDNHPDIVITD